MLRVLTCLRVEHDLGLVALSACICLLGCFSTVALMARAESSQPRGAWRWLAIAAVLFGCSVWALHFVAMLAFIPGAQAAYAVDLTLLSVVAVVVGTLAALLLWQHARARGIGGLLLAGASLGSAIAAMHYLGALAMSASGPVTFDSAGVAASILVSIACAGTGLVRARGLDRIARRLEVTVWLTLAICGLHFTGMSATTVAPLQHADGVAVIGSTQLALMVGIVSLAILIAGLVAILMQQHLSRRSLDELARMRLLADLAHEVLLIHREGRVLEINQAGCRLLGLPSRQIVGLSIHDLFAAHDLPRLSRRARCPAEERQVEEYELRAAGGALVPVELSCRPIQHLGHSATAVALRDLTDRRRDEARIRHLALHDALTDLPNRYLLEERLDHALNAAAQDGTSVALVYLDLDRFKPVNDLHGHAVGDGLLVQAARRMAAELRPADTLARIGGDEFVAVLTNASPERVATAAAQLVAVLSRSFHVDDHAIEIGASAGVALYPGDGDNPSTLLRAADTALYRVKDEGRGAVRFFEASMDLQLQARRQLEQELAGALDRGELQLFYQPLVHARTGEIETFEALVRWQHPVRGLVPPGAFIPLAEQSGLIARLGAWVIETACQAAATWPNPWRVSINVSPSQFRLSDVPELVATALADSGLAPNRLMVEITESVFIQDADRAVEVLSRLRALGVRLALDDFGTGYSSLSYLQRFNFDKIKIDQSFVARLGQNADTLTIVRAIANLAHNLSMQVVVEGVETIEQLAILRNLGCEQMQGYLFGRPLPDLCTSESEQTRLRALFAPAPTRLSA